MVCQGKGIPCKISLWSSRCNELRANLKITDNSVRSRKREIKVFSPATAKPEKYLLRNLCRMREQARKHDHAYTHFHLQKFWFQRTFSYIHIWNSGKVTTGNRDAYFTIHISKEVFLQRCLQPHMRNAVALVIISPWTFFWFGWRCCPSQNSFRNLVENLL